MCYDGDLTAPASCCCSRWDGCPSAAASTIEAICCSCYRRQASTSCYSDAAVKRQAEAVALRRSAVTRLGRSCCRSCLSSCAGDGKSVYGCPDQALIAASAAATTTVRVARGRATGSATLTAMEAYC